MVATHTIGDGPQIFIWQHQVGIFIFGSDMTGVRYAITDNMKILGYFSG
jgi:hypothetical protein